MIDATLLRYGVSGVVNTLAGLLIVLVLDRYSGLDARATNALAFAIALVFGFFVHKRHSFRHEGRHLPAFARYVTCFGVAFLLNFAVLSLLLAQSGLPVALAQAAGIGTFIVSFYVLNRRFVFRTAPDRR